MSNMCASEDKFEKFRRRSIIRRLWESYALEMITVLEMANKGKIGQKIAHQYLAEIVPLMKRLRDGGELQRLLERAELVIMNKVFNDTTEENQISKCKMQN